MADDGNEGLPILVQPSEATRSNKGPVFWLIFLSLCFSLFLSALELTAVSTALPVIVNDLHGGEFAWIGTAYSLASTAFLPMMGGFAEVFFAAIIGFYETC